MFILALMIIVLIILAIIFNNNTTIEVKNINSNNNLQKYTSKKFHIQPSRYSVNKD